MDRPDFYNLMGRNCVVISIDEQCWAYYDIAFAKREWAGSGELERQL